MSMVLRKLRSKKKVTSSSSSKNKKGVAFHKALFRAKDDAPNLQPGLTWTMSEDEETSTTSNRSFTSKIKNSSSSSSSSKNNVQSLPWSPVVSSNKQPPKQPKMESAVLTFTEKELMQHELFHMRQLAEKETEMVRLTKENQAIRQQYEQALEELKEAHQEALEDKDLELAFSQCELEVTKEELTKVSSVLMQTQSELFDLKEQSSQSFWGSRISTWC